MAHFTNASVSAHLWGLENPLLYPIYATPETIFVILSWYFFVKLNKGKYWLPDIRSLSYYFVIGITAPLSLYSLLLRFTFLTFGQINKDEIWQLFIATTLGDFISIIGFSIPSFYFLTPVLQQKRLISIDEPNSDKFQLIGKTLKKTRNQIELSIIVSIILVLSFLVEFQEYWFLYGIIALYTAIRYGFGITILINSLITLLTYILPAIWNEQFRQEMILGDEMTKIQLGNVLLYVFSLVTGRVISDARTYQSQITDQYHELEQTNRELDRFVYSISHDLSAPLKSIHGLVNIARSEDMHPRIREYFEHIGMSTNKLEDFIAEILDFSKNDRLPVKKESIDLDIFCNDIMDGMQFFENFENVHFDTKSIKNQKVYTDRIRLKIILTNLISNAVKYQNSELDGLVIIRATQSDTSLVLEVKDNGEGIAPDHLSKIYDMFYRGTISSHGSGLGLYIVKEVLGKLDGKIVVDSKLGEGTKFTVTLPVT